MNKREMSYKLCHLNVKHVENMSMQVLSQDEYKRYFNTEELFYITKYFGDVVTKALEGSFDLKY